MFNLTAFIQDDKKIKIQSLDDFYNNNTTIRDVTEFVDKDTSTVDSVLPYKQINFSYKGDKKINKIKFIKRKDSPFQKLMSLNLK